MMQNSIKEMEPKEKSDQRQQLMQEEIDYMKSKCAEYREKMENHGLTPDGLVNDPCLIKLIKLQVSYNADEPTVDSIATSYLHQMKAKEQNMSLIDRMVQEIEEWQLESQELSSTNKLLKGQLKLDEDTLRHLKDESKLAASYVTKIQNLQKRKAAKEAWKIRETLAKIDQLNELQLQIKAREMKRKKQTNEKK